MTSTSKKLKGKINSLSGEITIPGDKSITHRAIIFSSIAEGKSKIDGISLGADCISTINAFRAMGIKIEIKKNRAVVEGKGINGLNEPADVIDAGNSGTTIRLLTGLLAGQKFLSIITGDSSLRRRPMARIIKPLKLMGANITARANNTLAPIVIKGRKLHSIKYSLPISSAQVKTAIILAALQAEGITEIIEPSKSRDHTERMLKYFGGNIKVSGRHIFVKKNETPFKARDFSIPGDFSSAAFFIAAATLIENAKLIIRGVGINRTRTGFLQALRKMGGNFKIINRTSKCGEPCADIVVEASKLKAMRFPKSLVPFTIDEFPIIFVLASLAEGTSVFEGIKELRYKESDRISVMAKGLSNMGVEVSEGDDWIKIKGAKKLKGALIESNGDHRIAMSFSIAALCAEGTTTIKDAGCINISFPQFYSLLRKITAGR
ncbi:MAG: 3-phosphoshikimate 1-carboxyvinyltransferase [Candidatus Schekmanbacteria bacterium]|nr:MAG: 3-phosphoshikimate 1-carboxyvinyltransferase [Candidatus Schekmanbacteria bacterium]